MNRNSRKREIVSLLALSVTLIMGLGSINSPSVAAGLPTVRVISPEFDIKNDTFSSDQLGQYYASGGRSYFKYIGAGSTITITYLVTSDGTSPLPNKDIDFMVNAPYSGSKAKWEVDGNSVNASKDSATGYGLLVAGKTDASGKVSFTIKNTNDASVAEALPSSETQPRPSIRLYGNMKTVIRGLTDMQQAIDLITFDITKAPAVTLPVNATPTPSPTTVPQPVKVPSIRLISPIYNSKNSVDSTGDITKYFTEKSISFYTYIEAGTKLTLSYQVTQDGSTIAANQEIKLQINSAYSESNASWKTDTGAIVQGQKGGEPGIELIGKTDESGKVTFKFENVDTSNLENMPTSPLQERSKITPSRLYGTMKPVFPGKADNEADVDLVTFDITKVSVPTPTPTPTPSATPTPTPSATPTPTPSATPTPTPSATPTPTPSATPTPTPSATPTPTVTAGAPVAQTISSVATSLMAGKSLTLPAKSTSGLAIKWVSTTKTICTVSGSKVTAKKKGACSVTGANAGDAKNTALSVTKKITVK